MKGVVFLGDRKLELRDFPDPTPGPRDVILVVDRLDGTPVTSHWVIIDYWCDDLGGTLSPGSDAMDAAWVSPADLDRYDVPDAIRDLVQEAWRRAGLPRSGAGDTLSR